MPKRQQQWHDYVSLMCLPYEVQRLSDVILYHLKNGKPPDVTREPPGSPTVSLPSHSRRTPNCILPSHYRLTTVTLPSQRNANSADCRDGSVTVVRR